jgi:phosphohistidine phosphatase SixA
MLVYQRVCQQQGQLPEDAAKNMENINPDDDIVRVILLLIASRNKLKVIKTVGHNSIRIVVELDIKY